MSEETQAEIPVEEGEEEFTQSVLPIFKSDHDNLRNPLYKNSLNEDFNRDEIETLIEDMNTTLHFEGGVGLASNQVSDTNETPVFIINDGENYRCYINPEVQILSDDMETLKEGCLSAEGIGFEVSRPNLVAVRAVNLDGEPFQQVLKGFWARVVLHEMDHLNGISFMDRVSKFKRQRMREKFAKDADYGKSQLVGDSLSRFPEPIADYPYQKDLTSSE